MVYSNSMETWNDQKISPEFASRLRSMDPKKKVRAFVLVRLGKESTESSRSNQRAFRQHMIKSMRESMNLVLPDIDSILKHFGGRRLATAPSALGTLPIETTVDGIRALTDLRDVKAVFEDQPISSLSRHCR